MSLRVLESAEVAPTIDVTYICTSHIRQTMCHLYATEIDERLALFGFIPQQQKELSRSPAGHLESCRAAAAVMTMSFESIARDAETFVEACRSCPTSRLIRDKMPWLVGQDLRSARSVLTRVAGAFAGVVPTVCQSWRRPVHENDVASCHHVVARFVPLAEAETVAQRHLQRDHETLETHVYFERQLASLESEIAALVASSV